MKKYILPLVATIFLSACQNELYNDPQKEWKVDQAVYFSENPTKQVFIEADKDMTVNVASISLVNKVENDIKVKVTAGTQADLDEYAKLTGKQYILMPTEMYQLPTELVFPAKIAYINIPLHLKNVAFSLKGTYALPLKIKGQGLKTPKGQDQCIVVFEERLVTKSLNIGSSGPEKNGMFPDDFKVNQWTMEVMVNREAYEANNKSICGTILQKGSGTNDEIYVRFGDVTIQPDQLQMKTASSQIDVPRDKFVAKPNEWYMISFVYDGKCNSIYVNGKLVAEREMRTGPYGLTGFWIGGTNDLIREVRFYKVARTPQQINDYLWKMVDPTDPNLLLYYPMNGKKRDPKTGKITVDETMIWDWASGGNHMAMPAGAKWDDNGGEMFTFPLAK